MHHRTWNRSLLLVVSIALAAMAMGGVAYGAPPAKRSHPKADECPQPYIEKGEWKDDPYGPILEITPTPCGRIINANEDLVARDKNFYALVGEMVIRFSTNRYFERLPTMVNQLFCHARLFPDKPTWNIEPQRPYLSYDETAAAQCNPSVPKPDEPVH